MPETPKDRLSALLEQDPRLTELDVASDLDRARKILSDISKDCDINELVELEVLLDEAVTALSNLIIKIAAAQSQYRMEVFRCW